MALGVKASICRVEDRGSSPHGPTLYSADTSHKRCDHRGGSIAASIGSDCLNRVRVNSSLKVLDNGVYCVIAKGKYLHHDYRTGFPGRVNPEIGIVDASPRQGTAGTTAFDGLGVDCESQAKLVQRTGHVDWISGELGY